MTEPTYTLQEAAALMDIGPKRLFSLLRARKVLDRNNLPSPPHRGTGRFVVRVGEWESAIGPKAYGRTLVTHTGLQWLQRLVNKDTPTHSKRTDPCKN